MQPPNSDSSSDSSPDTHSASSHDNLQITKAGGAEIAIDALALDSRLVRALSDLGYSHFTPIQHQCITPALAGRDVLACAETGSGKTAAYLLPMLQHMLQQSAPRSATRGLVLVPTRELALQIQRVFSSLASFTYIKADVVIGGEAFKHQVAKLRKNPEILIATPGRLVEHLDKGSAELQDLEYLVLDEADQMLKMGFSEDLTRIASLAKPERQNLLFSATLKQKGMHRIQAWFQNPLAINLDQARTVNPAIQQQLVFADDDKHKQQLTLALLTQQLQLSDKASSFIFCNTRAQCQQLGNFLSYKKFKIGIIHSEIAQSERKQVMHQFRQGQLQAVVATDVAARGVDIDHVEQVINYSVAHSGDDHTHRIGRTGRAGQSGLAVSLIAAQEYNKYSSIERYLGCKAKRITLDGLAANYQGPKKTKRSGKAVGSKQKAKAKSPAKSKTKGKSSASTQQKRQQTARNSMVTSGDGFGSVRRRK